jgi:hypothetical protein
MTDNKPAVLEARVSPEQLQAAALTFANALREHLEDGLRQGRLESVLSGARCLEHLVGLAGPAVAAKVWRQACGLSNGMTT